MRAQLASWVCTSVVLFGLCFLTQGARPVDGDEVTAANTKVSRSSFTGSNKSYTQFGLQAVLCEVHCMLDSLCYMLCMLLAGTRHRGSYR